MTETKDIIIKLKEIREEKNLSFSDIMRLMEENGDYIAKSTLSRVFAEGPDLALRFCRLSIHQSALKVVSFPFRPFLFPPK